MAALLARDGEANVLTNVELRRRVLVTAPTPIGNTKAIIMRDPDGYFVEAIQATPAIIAATDALPVPGGHETHR